MTVDQDIAEQIERLAARSTPHTYKASSAWQKQLTTTWVPTSSIAKIQTSVDYLRTIVATQAEAIKRISNAVKANNAVFTDEDNIRVLMEHGWVMPLYTSAEEVQRLVGLFESNPDTADKEMCAILEGEVDHIRSGLVRRFPSRAPVLSDAFEAHEDGKYNFSVLVFLAQADGIWQERRDGNIFCGDRNNTINEFADDLPDGSLTRELVLALSQQTFPLFFSQSQRHPGFSFLNRHQVLHGESLDYGTRLYSCQAMAFLYYCGTLLPNLPDSVEEDQRMN